MTTYCPSCGFKHTYSGIKPLSCEACDELFGAPPTRPKPAAKAAIRPAVNTVKSAAAVNRRRFEEPEVTDDSLYEYSLADLDLSSGIVKAQGSEHMTIEVSKDKDGPAFKVSNGGGSQSGGRGQPRGGRIAGVNEDEQPPSIDDAKAEMIAKMLRPASR